MAKIPFTVAARTAKLIGKENFSNAEGAITELVKNTYDADAHNCLIIFKNHAKYHDYPEIYILDDGVGMTDEIIKNSWMNIGTNDKLINYTSELGRVKTGAKGIGRFALNRLGNMTHMYTNPINLQKSYEWVMNWSDFDRTGVNLHEVQAELSEIESDYIKNSFLNEFNDFESLTKLYSQIAFHSGTSIKISDLNDKWKNDSLNNLFSMLEMLMPPKEQPDFKLHLFCTDTPTEFGFVNNAYYDDYDYKLRAEYRGEPSNSIKIKITRNELDLNFIEEKYLDVFNYEGMKSPPYNKKTFFKKSFTKNIPISDLKGFNNEIDKELFQNIGSFDFTFYFLKLTVSDKASEGNIKKFPYKNFSSANRKAWIRKFGGVKIFRDGFKVRPYGDGGDDWLKLGERAAQSPGGAGQKLGGYRINPNQISGSIDISRVYNLHLVDKAGREGIQENDNFELFKNIIIQIISVFEKDRNNIMYYLSELNKKRDKIQKDKDAAKKAKEEVLHDEDISEESENRSTVDEDINSDNKKTTKREKVLAIGNQILEDELEEKEEEIRLLRSLASVGLIVSSFTHELKSIRSRIIPRTHQLFRELKKFITAKSVENLKNEENPLYMLRLMQDEDVKIKHWLDYSLNALKRDKRKRSVIHFDKYFNKFASIWSKALEQSRIKIQIIYDNTIDCSIRGFEVDMDSIFNNLLSNSITSLKKSKEKNKLIKISFCKKNDFVEIIFTDNGMGLAKQYDSNPNEIFNSFETNKTDNMGKVIGTGLGLYIVKSIIDEYDMANIEILSINDGFSLKILFKKWSK